MPFPYRSGFAALIGRPNVGKSTLLNRLAGEKLAIVSPKPQTTRNRILGVVTRPDAQVAFLDTPGVHQARGHLNRYMVDIALRALQEVDLVLLLVEPSDAKPMEPEVGPVNQLILEKLKAANKPTLLVINKTDAVPKPLILPLIERYRHELPFAEVVPISALTGDGVDRLLELVISHLPEAEAMFDADMLTDQAERTLVAEYVREQLLRHTKQEVPYAAAVIIDEFDESERDEVREGAVRRPGGLQGLVRIQASIYVERDSQKAIVIGKKGQMLKTIGTDARKSIERLLGAHVYLGLRVAVEPHWTERADGLRKLGYE
ncbi:MAG: GTPase Era [Myxococcaceae bacterium]